jgi:putative transposase
VLLVGSGGCISGVMMPKGLRRYNGNGHLHFVTFSCYQRLPLLREARSRDLMVRELAWVRDELGFPLVGYVIMPENVHVLLGETKDSTPSTVLHRLKLRTARKLRKKPNRMSSKQMSLPLEDEYGEVLRSFWQTRFYDFNVYSERKLKEKLEYMHENPLKRRLVTHSKDWPWSSWAFYANRKDFLVRMDVEN